MRSEEDQPTAPPVAVSSIAPELPVDPAEAPTDPSGEGEHSMEGPLPESALGTPLAEQVTRTDDALRAWRTESVRRREAWDEEQAALHAAAREVRLRRLRWGSVAGGLTLVAAGALAIALRPTPAPPPVVAAPVPVPVEVAAPAPAPAPAPVVVEAPPEPPAPAPVVVEAPAPAPVLLAGAAPSEVRLWSDRRYAWVSFVHPRPEALTVRWLDAAGRPALEPMGCARAECRAARSFSRIATAIAEGAAPGTWTVQACAGGTCLPLGTFASPPPRSSAPDAALQPAGSRSAESLESR